MITDEQKAAIQRLYFQERWRIGTIAKELGIHHGTVRRVLSQPGVDTYSLQRPSQIDSYVPFILDELQRHPKLTAARLYQMVKERGYAGGPDHFRHMVSKLRPHAKPEAFLKIRTSPGDEAQVDWASFGTVAIGKAEWQLSAFLMVLSHSRSIFVRFSLSQKMPWFLWGHEAAFEYFGGVPRVLLYDNLKSAVSSRRGDHIHFNKTLYDFSGHHGFEPRPVAPYRGNEKGRVERAVRYVRDSLFAGLRWSSLDELNQKALHWMETIAQARPWPDDKSRTVKEVFLEEQERLRPVSPDGFACEERKEVKVGKRPYIRFERNDYSVPSKFVRRTLVAYGCKRKVRIFDGEILIAEHPRCFDRDEVLETPEHIEELRREKRKSRRGTALDWLHRSVPESETVLSALHDRGEHLGTMVTMLRNLLDTYGSTALAEAIKEALLADSPHPNSIRHILDRKREERNLKPPIPIELPDDLKIRDLSVRPHRLADYDFNEENRNEQSDQEEDPNETDHPEQRS